MNKKDVVNRHSLVIGRIVGDIRFKLTSDDGEYPEDDEIYKLIEDELFNDCQMSLLSAFETKVIIESSFIRIKNKYGVLTELLDCSSVNEIMVNGPGDIFAEQNGELVRIDNAFLSEGELEEIIRMLASDVHREINEASPIVDARLPAGYRVNGVLNNVALNGPILTIRKFSENDITLDDLIYSGSISEECAEMLSNLVRCGYNVFISGGTSSGKTTFLNALSMKIGRQERVVIIEDSAELKINNVVNKVHMECRNANSIGKGEVNMQMLIKTSLRMRPDRIIVGEVRGKEVVDMIQAMNTGHSGSMSTGHGNSIKGMLNRLETMYLMDAQIPLYSVKNQIANAIDIMVHLQRDSKGHRGVVEVAELCGYDGNDYNLNYLYQRNSDGALIGTGKSLVDRNRLERGSVYD